MEDKKQYNLVQIITEIENDVRRLLDKNTRLKNQIFELSQLKQESQKANDKVSDLEEEIKKLRQTVSELQNQESTNRDRIFQIRKLIQEEINSKYSKEENTKKDSSEETSIPFNSTSLDESEVGEVDYNPYIGVDEEDIITHQPVVGVDDEENFSPVSIETQEKQKESSPNKELKEKSKEGEKKEPEPTRDLNKIYVERPKLNVVDNPNSFLINNFTKEEDPFGDESSKMDDDEFFKSNS